MNMDIPSTLLFQLADLHYALSSLLSCSSVCCQTSTIHFKLCHFFVEWAGLEHKTNDWVRSKIKSLVGPQEPLLVTVKKRKLAWFRHVTASPRTSFRAPCRVGDTVVGRGNAGWTTSKSGHPCPCQNYSPLYPPDDQVGQETELN